MDRAWVRVIFPELRHLPPRRRATILRSIGSRLSRWRHWREWGPRGAAVGVLAVAFWAGAVAFLTLLDQCGCLRQLRAALPPLLYTVTVFASILGLSLATALASSAVMAAPYRRRLHDHLRNRHGEPYVCFACGYPLRGLPAPRRCPECGWRLPA